MRILQFAIHSDPFAQTRLGILSDTGDVIDANSVWIEHFRDLGYFDPTSRANHVCPSSLSSLLKLCPAPFEFLQQTQEYFQDFTKQGRNLERLLTKQDEFSFRIPLNDINCYRDFYTHEKHVKKGFEKRGTKVPDSWYEMPVFYKGATSGFIGTQEKIMWPSYTEKLDYELELAAVIGKDGKNISANHAFEHIFGFTILNDISARDIQKKEMSVGLGPSKGKDFCSVLGPVITTIDEFEGKNPDLLMEAFINNQKWSSGRSSESNFGWEEIISFASQDEWLLATDVLGQGTVGSGCGLEIDKWIAPGDSIELRVEKIGSLKNQVDQKITKN